MEIKNPNWGYLVFWRYFWGDAETHQAAHWTCSPTGSDLCFWKFPSFPVPLCRSTRHREWIATWTPSRTERDAMDSSIQQLSSQCYMDSSTRQLSSQWYMDSSTRQLASLGLSCTVSLAAFAHRNSVCGHDTSVLTVWPQSTLSVHIVKWPYREWELPSHFLHILKQLSLW